MSHLVSVAQLLDSGCGVTAADDGDGVGLAQSFSNGLGAGCKLLELEHAHGAVPDHGAGVGNGVAVGLGGLRTDVQTLPAVRNSAGGHDLGVSVRSEGVGSHGIGGQQQFDALLLGLLDHVQGILLPVSLQQRVADLSALSSCEGVSHAAADDDGISDLQQVVDDADLGRDLGAAQNGDQRTLGSSQSAADDLQLLLNQEAGHSRQVSGNTGGGGVSAVNRAERVGHIDALGAGQVSQSLGKLGVVLGLALVIAQVLQQQDLTGLQSSGLGLSVLTHDVLGQDHFLAQQLGQTGGHGLHAQLGLPLALGLAHVRAGDDSGVLLQQVLDGGQSGADALVVGDHARAVLGHGDVEIAAQQNLLAGDVNVSDSFLVVIHTNYSFPFCLLPICSGKVFI